MNNSSNSTNADRSVSTENILESLNKCVFINEAVKSKTNVFSVRCWAVKSSIIVSSSVRHCVENAHYVCGYLCLCSFYENCETYNNSEFGCLTM